QSEVALPIVQSLWMQAGPFLSFLFRSSGTTNAKNHHAEIIRALRRRDPIGVSAGIRADLSDAADIILSREQFLVPRASGNQHGSVPPKRSEITPMPQGTLPLTDPAN